MTQKEFIPYEQALELKELGFDEACMASRDMDNGEGLIQLPLYQQAFRWFREKYNLKGHIEAVEYLDGTPDTYHWSIFNKCNSGYDQLTYEEAELECLKKLIEIVKDGRENN